MLPAVPLPRPGMCGVCVCVEPAVAWRVRLGRVVLTVQLASRPDGNRSGGGVRQR